MDSCDIGRSSKICNVQRYKTGMQLPVEVRWFHSVLLCTFLDIAYRMCNVIFMQLRRYSNDQRLC